MQKLHEAFSKINEIKHRLNALLSNPYSNKIKSNAIESLREEEKKLMLEYAADPDLFIHIKCWLIDIYAHSELSDEDMKTIQYDETENLVPPDGLDIKDYTHAILNKAGGNIGHLIQNHLHSIGIHNYKINANKKNWNISIHLSNESANFVCQSIFYKFSKSIKNGIFTVIRKPWYYEFELDQ
jgi:hypothetical protein